MLPLLRALSRGGTSSSAPWIDPGGAGLLPTCSFCLGRAKPPASPPEPGPPHPTAAPEGFPSPSCPPERRSTFVALKRLLERSRSVPELLRWLWQNPGRVSGAHYALALGHLGRLLPQDKGGPCLEPLLHQPDFQHLSRAVARRCAQFDDATLVRCLHASAALGLPGDSRLVLALQDEAQRRLERLRRRDVSTASGKAVRLRPLSHAAAATTPPPSEACQGSPEPRPEEQRRLQTLFLLLSYYRLRAQKQQEETPPVRREFLRLVHLSLRQLQVAQEEELALLEQMLCLGAREASGSDTLGAIFGSRLFYQNRRENFICSMADWFPGKAGGLTPPTMALVAKYLSRHRLREPRLLDAIATFLLERAQQLESKMIQKLVFPFSRLNFRPSNHADLFPRLEAAVQKPGVSPLAALNTLMSLVQLCHFPPALLRQVFSPAFLANVTSSPCGQIVLRYLSLLDAAVALEVPGYRGPRLPPQYRVRMFEGALTADKANRKYSYKGLVGEALCQLVGRGCFRQDEVVPPGYCVDFLLWVTPSGGVLPLGGTHSSPKGAAPALASGTQNSVPLGLESTAGSLPPLDSFCGPSREPSPETPFPSSPTRTDPSPVGSPCSTNGTHFSFPARGQPETELGLPAREQLLRLPPADKGGHPQGFSPQGPSTEGTAQGGPQEKEGVHRVVLSVNDQWHYCHGSSVLVGSRAMRSRHLCLLGYRLVQLPYQELEKMRGVEETKLYLRRKLKELQF
ncbi:fas-activated serine/threonine kinase [Lacerta agilis]|uniref:fas-activated serine/threonine kinase n=1 Tax=Lacerta agilis TaxID=80427 RepID=UPI001419EA06|nr:fas-activated serine/threonine kinase [Lacerta agilis]